MERISERAGVCRNVLDVLCRTRTDNQAAIDTLMEKIGRKDASSPDHLELPI
jgi:hypothetical protein